MKIKKVIFAILFSAGCLGPAVAEPQKNIRLGTEASYAPFESKTPQGEVVGFDIDLINEMCKRMNAHCTLVETEYDALIPSLKARKIDAVIAAMSITPKRLKEIDFTDKLYAANSRLIAAKGSSLLPDVKVLQGKRVGVLQGSIQDVYANKYWRPNGVDVVTYQSQDMAYSDLASGRLDATFQDEVAGSYGFLKQPVGKDYSFAGASVKDLEIFGPGTGIGLRKGDTELQSAFNNALQSMLKDGTYKKIADKYFDFDIYAE